MDRTIVYAGALVAGAQAVAVRAGRIVALGDPSSLCRRFEGEVVRHVRGRFFPASLDGHLHLVDFGLALGETDLRGLDAAQTLERLRAARAQGAHGEFLLGRGARPGVLRQLSQWPDALAELAPLRVWAQDLHTALTDPGTVRRLGLLRAETPGGEVVRDLSGEATGLLRESATMPLAAAAQPDQPSRERAARRAIEALWQRGIVGAVTFERADGESAVARATEEMPFRAYVYRYAESLQPGERPQTLSRRSVRVGAKYFLDGTLGSRTAWMLAPYADDPGTGMPRLDPDEAREGMRELAGSGFSLALHAIGDRAAQEALRLLEGMPLAAAPHRIEHLQVVPEGFAQRLAQAGVTASVQPCHLEQDLAEAKAAWADRLERAYPYVELLSAGANLCFGSDAPVEDPSLQLGLRWATSADAVGGGVRHGVSVEEGLAAYTQGVLRSVGAQDGQVAVGETANLALYENGPMQDAMPMLVLSEGEPVHEVAGAYREEAL